MTSYSYQLLESDAGWGPEARRRYGAALAILPYFPAGPDPAPWNSRYQRGEPVMDILPEGLVATMVGPKRSKTLADVMVASSCLLLSPRVKGLLDTLGATEIDYQPISVIDHDGGVARDDYWFTHVRCSSGYIDFRASSARVIKERAWGFPRMVVDESLLQGRPVLFRLARANCAWIFLRQDLIEALREMEATGWRAHDLGEARAKSPMTSPWQSGSVVSSGL